MTFRFSVVERDFGVLKSSSPGPMVMKLPCWNDSIAIIGWLSSPQEQPNQGDPSRFTELQRYYSQTLQHYPESLSHRSLN